MKLFEPCGQQTSPPPHASPQPLQFAVVPRGVSQSGAASQSRRSEAHVHAYDPGLFVHVPPAPQGAPAEHSLMSVHVAERPLPVRLKPGRQAQV
jgi:hypothetical protein